MVIYLGKKREQLQTLAEKYEWELSADELHEHLSDYIGERLQLITDLSFLIIERDQITESEHDFNETIETLKYMYETNIIVLESELADENGESKNVIYHENYTSLWENDEHCIQNIEYLLTGQKIPQEFEMEGIWIGIMSSNSGAGATALAIGLANFIHQYDTSVCYVEANESGDLAAMAGYYGFEKMENGHYQRNGLDYWHQSIDNTKKYVIIDLGKYNANKLRLLNQCKEKILITDSKPYRMADVVNVYHYINDENARIVLNYGDQDAYQRIRSEYLSDVQRIHELAIHYDLFNVVDPFYEILMQDYLHVSDQKKSATGMIRKFLMRKASNASSSKETEEKTGIFQEEDMEQPEEISVPEIISEEEGTDDLNLENPEEKGLSDIEQVPLQEYTDESDIQPESQEKTQVKRSEKKKVKTLVALAIIATGSLGIFYQMRSNRFVFTNGSDSVTEKTEQVDEELNINPDIKISVLEVEGADGYEVSYSTDESFPKEKTVVVEVETADKAVESLAADKTYYVRVRAFKFKEDGTKVYGEYTDVQKIRT